MRQVQITGTHASGHGVEHAPSKARFQAPSSWGVFFSKPWPDVTFPVPYLKNTKMNVSVLEAGCSVEGESTSGSCNTPRNFTRPSFVRGAGEITKPLAVSLTVAADLSIPQILTIRSSLSFELVPQQPRSDPPGTTTRTCPGQKRKPRGFIKNVTLVTKLIHSTCCALAPKLKGCFAASP